MKRKSVSWIIFIISLVLITGNSAQENRNIKEVKGETKKPPAVDKIATLKAKLRKAKDDTNKVNFLNGLADEFNKKSLSDSGIKYAEQAIELSMKLKWDNGLADGYLQKGASLFDSSKYDEAKKYIEKSLEICEKIKYNQCIALNYRALGNYHRVKQQYELSRKFFDKAIEIYIDISDLKNHAATSARIGFSFMEQKLLDSALVYYGQAIQLSHEANEKEDLLQYLIQSGNINYELNNISKSMDAYEKALIIAEDIGDSKSELNILQGIAGLYANKQGNFEKAVYYMEKGLKTAESIGDKSVIIDWLKDLAVLYNILKNKEKVTETCEKAKKLAEVLDDKRKAAECMVKISEIFAVLSDFHTCLDYMKKALKLAEDASDKELTSMCNLGMAQTYYYLSNYPRTLEYAQKAYNIAQEYNYKSLMTVILELTGVVYSTLTDYSHGIDCYKKALEIKEELGDKSGIMSCNLRIASLNIEQKEFDKAVEYSEKAAKIIEETGFQIQDIESIFTLIGIFTKSSNYLEAFRFAEKAKEILGEYNIAFINAEICGLTGLIHYRVGVDNNYRDSISKSEHLSKAKDLLEKALDGLKNTGLLKGQMNVLDTLSKTYIALGDYKNALEKQTEAQKLKDSIFSSSKIKQIAELEARKDLEIKQKENELLSEKAKLQQLELERSGEQLRMMRSEKEIQSLEIFRKNNMLNLLEKDKEIRNLALRQQVAEKQKADKEILLLYKDKQYHKTLRNYLLSGLGLLFGLALMLFLFFWRKKKHNEELNRLNFDLELKNIEITEQKEELEKANILISSDLKRASDYIFSLLPPKLDTAGLKTDWILQPSAQLGGDIFGYHWIDDNHFAVYLLDVSGHGVGASLHAVSVLNILKSDTLALNPSEPEKIVNYLNENFQMAKHNNIYFTLWYGVFNPENRKFKYVNAGHPAPLILTDNDSLRLDTQNLPVGFIPERKFTSEEITVPEKSNIFLFSDGAYEIMKESGEVMSPEELYNIITEVNEKNRATNSHCRKIFDEMCRLNKSSHFNDDFSLLKVEID